MANKEIILLFENAKENLGDVRKCMIELLPCEAKSTDDKSGILLKKSYSNDREYDKIMEIKKKYGLNKI